MQSFVKSTLDELIAGVPAWAWVRFLKAFKEGADDESINRTLQSIEKKTGLSVGLGEDDREQMAKYLDALALALRANQ